MGATLVTGGSGLVGSTIKGDGVVKLSSDDADLTRPVETAALFDKIRPSRVIHCAARVGGVQGNMNGQGVFFRENILMNTYVLEYARLYGVEKVLSFLSTCIFPDALGKPIAEKDLHAGPPHSSNFGYAYAKRMAQVQSAAYREQYDFNSICLVPTNVYGLRDNFDLVNGHVIPCLIHKCYLARRNNEPFVIWGSGKPLREFIFAEDLGRICMWALDNYDDVEPLIASTSKEHSIAEVADIIATCFGFQGKIEFDADRPEGQYRKPSNTSKLRQLLPDFKFTSLDEGIGRTVEWFQRTYPNVRK